MSEDPDDCIARRSLVGIARVQIAAGFVHLFTATGSICALLAVWAATDGAYERAFIWLLVALVIDAVDGALARAVDVEVNLPRFSGERLDLVVDYVTYVFVPVLILVQSGILQGLLGRCLAGSILLSSLYHFADTESKTEDNCFVGFPAVWNLVAFCLLAWDMRGGWAAILVAVLVVLTFVPMRWVHPMRVKRLFAVNVGVMAAGLAASAWVLWRGFPASSWTGAILAAASLYYLAIALVWSWRRGA